MADKAQSGRITLTDAMLRKLRYDPKRAEKAAEKNHPRMIVRDATIPILEVRVTPNGTKTFYVTFKPRGARLGKRGFPVAGKTKRLRIGEYHPDIGALEAARSKAAEYLHALQSNRDPHAEAMATNTVRYTNTFESAMRRFISTAMCGPDEDNPKFVSWEKCQNTLQKYVEPKWKGRPLQDIRRDHATEIRDALIAEGKVGTAREVWKHTHRMFEWAVETGIVEKNPLHSMRKKGQDDLLASNTDAGRELEDYELRAIWHAAASLGYPFGPWFQLLMLTGQRRADWANASRSEIKTESELEKVQKKIRTAPGAKERFVLEIPGNRYKSRRDHIVPLVPAAMKIIDELPKWDGNDYSLFSGRAGKSAISGFSKAKAQLDEEVLATLQKKDAKATLTAYRVHDFRVTMRTRMGEELEIPEPICEAVIGHAQGFLTKVYNKALYLPQRREALAAYADHLLKVVK